MSVNKMSSLLAILLAANAYISVAAAQEVSFVPGIELVDTILVDEVNGDVILNKGVYVDLNADYNSSAVNTGAVNAWVEINGTVGSPEIIGTGTGNSTATANIGLGENFDNEDGLVQLGTVSGSEQSFADSLVDVKVDTADFAYLQSKIYTQGIGAYNDATLEIAQNDVELDVEYSNTEDAGWVWFNDNESTNFELELEAEFSTASVLNVAYNSGVIDASVWITGGVDGLAGPVVASVIGADINTTAIGAYNVSDVTVK